MAGNPAEVWKMITDLERKSKRAAESELQTLQVNKVSYVLQTDIYASEHRQLPKNLISFF